MELSEERLVTLSEYARRIGYRECAFWGINHPDNDRWECRQIWTQRQRDMVEAALRFAEEQIEGALGYHLVPKWIAGEMHKTGARGQTTPLLKLARAHFTRAGVREATRISRGEPVDYSSDPAIITTIVADDVPADELVLVHEAAAAYGFQGCATHQVIEPTCVTREAGTGVVTFEVPWCRLVAPACQDNPSMGYHYENAATEWGAQAVDVWRVRTDPSQAATLVRVDRCNGACSREEVSGCVLALDERKGFVRVQPATWDADAEGFLKACLSWCPEWVEVNYLSGLEQAPPFAYDAVIRLAHAQMATEPCGCEVTQHLWARDRNVPQVVTRERVNCPWGMNDGAWTAWRFAQANRLVRGSVL